MFTNDETTQLRIASNTCDVVMIFPDQSHSAPEVPLEMSNINVMILVTVNVTMIVVKSLFLKVLRCLLSVGLLVGEAAAWLSLLGQLGGEVKIMRMIMLKSTQ